MCWCDRSPALTRKRCVGESRHKPAYVRARPISSCWDCIVYYLKNTGIPVNFGITITIALIVGTVVAGQTFYLFTLENLKQFGALKAIGVTNWRLTGMVLLQAFVVGLMGFGLGTGMAAAFFEATLRKIATRGIILMWQSVDADRRLHLVRCHNRQSSEYPARHRVRGGDSISRVNRARKPIHCDFVPRGAQALRQWHARPGIARCRLRGPAGGTYLHCWPERSGKTTLLSVITGLLDPSDGEVELFGSKAGRLPANQRILFRRENVGFVFQQFNLLPALTAAENAAVPLIAAGMKRTEAVERAKALLDQLGLNGRRDALPATMSGGEQQRVAIARALVHEPRLVVCDEPTAALDHATGEAVMKLVAANAVHPDRAAVVVTHDSRVFHFADVIAHMDDGRIVKTERNSKKEIQS